MIIQKPLMVMYLIFDDFNVFKFENPCDDDIREHGTQVWSYDRTSMMFDFSINLLSVKN